MSRLDSAVKRNLQRTDYEVNPNHYLNIFTQKKDYKYQTYRNNSIKTAHCSDGQYPTLTTCNLPLPLLLTFIWTTS